MALGNLLYSTAVNFALLWLILECQVIEVFGFAPGSCIAANYTDCCSSVETGGPCAGSPPTCFCDPSCKEFNDCCSDLDQICRDPALDEALDSLRPVITYPSSLTFHTADLHWLVLPDTNRVNVSGNYHILLTEAGANKTSNSSSSLTTPTPASFNFSVQIRNISDNDTHSLRYRADLYGLKEGTKYRVDMVIQTNIGSLDNAASTDFTTMNYNYRGQIQWTITSSSSVLVTWNPLSVPEGISVKHYELSYGLRGEKEVVEHMYSSMDTRRSISGLRSNSFYSLDVSAVIQERDGSLHSQSLVTPSSGLEFYVPGSSYIQLVTESSSLFNCSRWNEEFESSLKTLFHNSILDHLNSHSPNPSPLTPSNVQDKQIICEVIPISSSRATYRAEVFGTQHMSSENLVSSIETWVKGGVILPSVAMSNWPHVDITLSKDCSVLIERVSEPFCGIEHVQSESDSPALVSERQEPPPWSVSWWVFVVAMATETVVLVLVFLSVALLVCHLRARHSLKNVEDNKSQCSYDKERNSTPSITGSHSNSTTSSPQHHKGSTKELL